MSCGDRPPPGFGAAAAGGGSRPPRMDFGGTKSATRTSTVASTKTETDVGNFEVLQQSQMQNETMASQSSCQTESSLAGDLRPCKKSKGLGKHGKLEDNEGTTDLRRLQTPINLFEDECVFCHSFRTSEIHGPMVLIRKGRIVSNNEGHPTNTIYVHKKCMDWAPEVYLDGDIIYNVDMAISSASTSKCSRCGLPGAALYCYHHPCAQTYHVPCAVMIRECCWDLENFHVWCPKHASDQLPCDEMPSPIMESGISPSILQNQYLDKQGMSDIDRREDQQEDQLNTSSSSSLPQGQRWDKEGIPADYGREDKQKNQSRTPVNQWVLLGSVLSESEKDSLKEFSSLTGSAFVEEWNKNVTHVIVGRHAGISCGRSYEVLMAILSGKWVVTAGWIVDCLVKLNPRRKTFLADRIPDPEVSYKVKFFNGSRTSIDGQNKGRAGATEVAPKLFSGLYFYLSTYMKPDDTGNIKNLIAAAEGQVLEGISPRSLKENLDKNPVKVYFVHASTYCLDLGKEMEEATEYWASGAQVISELSLYGAITAYDAQILGQIST